MNALSIILQILLLVIGVFLVVAVLLQKSKNKLSGSIAGGNRDSFYDKDQSLDVDRQLDKWTKIAAIVFTLIVVVVYVIQPDYADTTYATINWKDLTRF